MRFRSKSGLSIVELLVSSGLVLLLMGEVWMMLRAGTKFYLRVQGQTEIQRASLMSLRWLSKDLAESAPGSFRHYDPENPTVITSHDGLVFGSPKDLDGRTFYDDEGHLLWASMIGYYIDPATNVFYRVKQALPDQRSTAPTIDDAVHHIDLLADLPRPRTIARDVIDLDTEQGPSSVQVTLKLRNEKFGYGLIVRTRLEMKNK